MNLLSFNKRFPSEDSCKQYLRQKREDDGLICKRCGSMKHYWLEDRELWKCAECGSWTNLKANTIMHKSKVPVYNWFLCIHLMTSTKKSISALEMQRQLGMKRYEPVWYMMHKIRIAMGKRDKQYKLKGNVEVDDCFFEIVDVARKKDDDNKRGRGSSKQKPVLVMVESTPNPKQKSPHIKKRIMGFAKMIVVDDVTTATINYELETQIERRSTIWTDGYYGYIKSPEVGFTHARMVVKPKEAGEKLPWVHTMISNAKRLFLGTHHSINKKYLQNYLNEFCWKLNRRTFETDLFDRMLTCGAADTWF